jgi:hypothetical protein
MVTTSGPRATVVFVRAAFESKSGCRRQGQSDGTGGDVEASVTASVAKASSKPQEVGQYF